MFRTFVAALVAAVATAGAAQSADPAVMTVFSLPHGAFFENVDTAADGRLLVTDYTNRAILAVTPGGREAGFANLDVHPAGILATATGAVVTAHGKSFVEGPDFVTTQQFLVLDRRGAIVRRVAAPDARFLNGLVRLPTGDILAADSIAGVIWHFDPATGAVKPWLSDPQLLPDPAQPPGRPGANGLKVRGGWLYISNTSRGTLYRIALKGGSPAGALTTYANVGPIDDFAFDRDGSIVFSTHGAALNRLAADGKAVKPVIRDGCDSCTSVAFGGSGKARAIYVLTTGNFVTGGKEPARVLRIRP